MATTAMMDKIVNRPTLVTSVPMRMPSGFRALQ
jgi:hypothetical protein